MRQRHRAVDKANIDLVWPQALPLFQKSNSIEFFDKKLDKDQRATVESFVNGYNGNVPFLLFGPFGTGKTRTINEIIRQLAKRKKKVLVCTKSNSACEIIVKELSQDIPPDKLFRLMALYRKIESVKKKEFIIIIIILLHPFRFQRKFYLTLATMETFLFFLQSKKLRLMILLFQLVLRQTDYSE